MLFRSRGGREGIKIDELAAKTKYSLIQQVIDFDNRPQAHLFVEAKLARNVQIEKEFTGPLSGIARQVSRLPDGRQRKQIMDCWVDRTAGRAPVKQFRVTSENRAIISHVVEVAVVAANGDVEWRTGRQTQQRSKTQLAKLVRRFKRSRENKTMSAIKQAASSLGKEVAGSQRVGSVYDAVVG